MIGLVDGLGDISDILQNIQEERDDTSIQQVSKHGADDGHNEEGLDGIAVLIAHSTHVGHSIGRGTETEAAHTCTEHGSIVAAA